jgi:hypothetical protein
MKLLFSTSLILSLSLSLNSITVIEAGKTGGVIATCEKQAPCLQVTVNEIDSKCGSHVCEYEVCWRQKPGGNGCEKAGDVQYIGDMFRYGDTEDTADGGCLNEENANGKGYWDTTCTDPENVYSDGTDWTSFFSGICQIVSPGHTVHLLINDGATCSGSSTIADFTKRGITANCLPSTQDSTSTTGQTYFPASDGEGGTCSGEVEGYDCVWSITVPDECAYQEGGQSCDDSVNANEEDICENSSVLNYYEHEKNGAPPIVPIHDITLNGDSTVTFRVANPFGDEFHDLYTVYHEAADDGNEECNKEATATSCPSDTLLTAACLDDGKYTVVTVFAASFDDDSGAAQLVTAADSDGSEIYECCPKSIEPTAHVLPAHVAAWTYVIYCECPEDAQDAAVRALRVRDLGLAEQFQRGELFDAQTKMLYGIN